MLHVSTQGQRSTVDSKRRQILMLDEAVYHVKMDFNKRFLALREVKKKVCQQVAEVQGRLRDALSALGKPTTAVVDPVLKPEETPELRDQVTANSATHLPPKELQTLLASCLSGFLLQSLASMPNSHAVRPHTNEKRQCVTNAYFCHNWQCSSQFATA